MKTKFKFKLEALYKLRYFKEKKLKVELGHINQEIGQVKSKIKSLEDHISETYQSQDEILQSSSSGQLARFFPYFIQAKKEDIKNQKNLLFALEKKYQNKLQEVHQAMGETEIIVKMKEKAKDEWRKEIIKKEALEIEEILHMRRGFHPQKGEDL